MFVKVEISQVCRWAWSPSAVAVHCFAESEPGANKCAEKRTCTAEALCQCPAVPPPSPLENVYQLSISLLLKVLYFQKLLAVCSDCVEGVNSGAFAYPRESGPGYTPSWSHMHDTFRAVKMASGWCNSKCQKDNALGLSLRTVSTRGVVLNGRTCKPHGCDTQPRLQAASAE